ncbi:MAG: hypothetical protein LBQ50_03770 [Planctomycetaceae bacterium]|nr:hypothetical protein [Planctomycetaceae bacterium]
MRKHRRKKVDREVKTLFKKNEQFIRRGDPCGRPESVIVWGNRKGLPLQKKRSINVTYILSEYREWARGF